MKLPELGVRLPVFTTIVLISVLILGGISYSLIPLDLLPEIEQPAISIITPYLGVSAEDIEKLVTKEIENTVNSVGGIDKITSQTKDNISVVALRFKWGTNLDAAVNDVRSVLEFAKRDLPNDIEPPQIFKFNTAQWPVVFYCITATKSWPNLRTMAEKQIADRVKTVPGVGTVRLIAGIKRRINVELDANRLKAYSISTSTIGQLLAFQNMTVTAGNIDIGRNRLPVRVPGEFKDPKEIEDVIIGVGSDGGPVKVRDVGRVEDAFDEQDERVFLNKNPAILFMVMKQTGGNTVQVVEDVEKRVALIQETLPADVKINKLFDTAQFIKSSIGNLKDTIYVGGVLVMLVVYAFLRRFRSSLIIGMTIPFSLIITFIFLYFFGYTINMMSLAALAISIGMVVDNAIVILDNITRHLEKGKSIKLACVDGASEVGLAVSASTITNVVIFVPLFFVGGFTGVMFKQLGFVNAVAMFASLFASLFFTPMMASKILARDALDGFTTSGKLGIYTRFEAWYLRLVDWALIHRFRTVMIAFGLFAFSVLLLLVTRVEFMPQEDTGDFRMYIELSPGTNVTESTKVGQQISDILMKNMVGTNGQREWENIFIRTGQSATGFSTAIGEKEGDNVIEAGGRLISRKLRTHTTMEYADIIRPLLQKIPGITKLEINPGNPLSQFFGGGKPIQVEIKGDDLFVTNKYARELQKIIRDQIPGTEDVTVSRDFGRPSISVNINRERASLLGLNVAMTALQLRTALYGSVVTKYRIKDDEYDIFLRLQPSDRGSIEQLKQIPIVSLIDKTITVGNIADVDNDITPIVIDRLDQQRVVKVEANTASGAKIGDIAFQIRDYFKKTPPPKGVNVTLGGDIEMMEDAFKQLLFMGLLGLLLVYMVMAAQFENYIDPLIIMFTVPFELTGVFLFITITRATFNLYTFLGIIMLTGIVVNNAIVYVDFTNVLRRQGMSLLEAARAASTSRLRPILMTSLTTIFGMLPMALSRSEGAEFWKPLGISVIGGLLVSGTITLVLIPALYVSIYARLEKRGRGIRKNVVIDEQGGAE